MWLTMASLNRCTPKLNSDIILNYSSMAQWIQNRCIHGQEMSTAVAYMYVHALALFPGSCVGEKEIASFKTISKLQRERLHQSHALPGTPGPAAATCM